MEIEMPGQQSRTGKIEMVQPTRSIEELRMSIIRKAEAFISATLWRECPQRLCRRVRRCEPPAGLCVAREAGPPMSDEEWAPRAAELKRMLAERLAELRAARATDVKG
jgi:hypothetical protein